MHSIPDRQQAAATTEKTHLLMVHGIQGTSRAWRKVAQHCSSNISFTLPDLRGRGAALQNHGPKDYHLENYADDLQEVIAANVGNAPFFLIGWSMGVSVILEYLLSNREPQPQGLVLLSGSPALSSASWFTSQGEQLMRDIAERERALGLQQAADHQAVAWTWEAIRDTDQRSGLANIDIPALIIHGSEDQDSPLSHAHWLAEGLPHAELYVIRGAGHMLLSECPDVVAKKIDRFIATCNKSEKE